MGLTFIYSCSQTVKTIDKYINMDNMNMNMNITPHPPHRLSVATNLSHGYSNKSDAVMI